MHRKQIDKDKELYAIYVYKNGSTIVFGQMFKVVEFVKKTGFYPYGVRLEDLSGEPVPEIHFIQQFDYFEFGMN